MIQSVLGSGAEVTAACLKLRSSQTRQMQRPKEVLGMRRQLPAETAAVTEKVIASWQLRVPFRTQPPGPIRVPGAAGRWDAGWSVPR